MLAKIGPLVDRWYFTDLPTPRAATAQALLANGRRCRTARRAASTHAEPRGRLRAAAAAADPADRIVVFGSFYTVGGVLKHGPPPSRQTPRLTLTMALFKLRKKKVDEPAATPPPAESVEVMRRRARPPPDRRGGAGARGRDRLPAAVRHPAAAGGRRHPDRDPDRNKVKPLPPAAGAARQPARCAAPAAPPPTTGSRTRRGRRAPARRAEAPARRRRRPPPKPARKKAGQAGPEKKAESKPEPKRRTPRRKRARKARPGRRRRRRPLRGAGRRLRRKGQGARPSRSWTRRAQELHQRRRDQERHPHPGARRPVRVARRGRQGGREDQGAGFAGRDPHLVSGSPRGLGVWPCWRPRCCWALWRGLVYEVLSVLNWIAPSCWRSGWRRGRRR